LVGSHPIQHESSLDTMHHDSLALNNRAGSIVGSISAERGSDFGSSVSTGMLPQTAWGRGYRQTRAHVKLLFLEVVRSPGQAGRRRQPDPGIDFIGDWGLKLFQSLLSCHPGQSEGSQAINNKILRYAQNDK
jgi:hypothetical protein